MDELEEIEKNAAPSSQAVLYRPAPTVEERRAAGLTACETCPIETLGAWEPRASSKPAIDLIEQQSATRDYYVRQLWNGKGSIDLAEVGPESLENVARLCAWSLAHAHARTGDEVAISAYLDDGHAFEDAMWDFARAYADQNDADYQAFIERVNS